MQSLLIALTLSSPQPDALSSFTEQIRKDPAFRDIAAEVCVNDECETVETSRDIWDPKGYELQAQWETVYEHEDKKIVDKVSDVIGKVVGKAAGAVSAGASVEVTYKDEEPSGKKTEVSVKISGGVGEAGLKHKGPPQPQN